MTEEVGTNEQGAQQRGTYRFPETAISDELRDKIASVTGVDAVAYPAKAGGSYKGPVIHADESFIVQAVGRDRSSAVLHQRSDLEVQGAALRQRYQRDDLIERNIQVHYRGTTAKVFPWDPARTSSNRTDGDGSSPAKQAQPDRDALLATATGYARDAFKTGKQRDAFVAHVAAMLDPNRVVPSATPSPTATVARKAGLTPAKPTPPAAVPAEPAR